jgi:hypothetical protein
VVAGGDKGIRVIALGLSGRRDEARRELASMRRITNIPLFHEWTTFLSAWLDRRVEEMRTSGIIALTGLKIQEDPEAIFQVAWLLCDGGDYETGLPQLQRAVSKGYFVAPTLASSPHFDPVRADPAFQSLLHEAEAGRARARAAFRDAGGERLLAR